MNRNVKPWRSFEIWTAGGNTKKTKQNNQNLKKTEIWRLWLGFFIFLFFSPGWYYYLSFFSFFSLFLFSSSKKKFPPVFFSTKSLHLMTSYCCGLLLPLFPHENFFSRKFLFSYPPWLEVRNNFSRKTSQQQPTNTK